MAFNGVHKAAIGAALTVGIVAGGLYEREQEDRPAHPEGLVCVTELGPGESPHGLADQSAFADDTETVIARSQFINPYALLAYADENETSFEGAFNVLRGDKPSGTPNNRPYFGTEGANCTTDDVDRKLTATVPSIEVGEQILKSTVALREQESSYDEFGYWRCGAIAVSDSTVVLTATDFISGPHSCVDLAKGESGDTPLNIVADNKIDGLRLIDTSGGDLVPAEIAPDEYAPKQGEVMVYSGYSRGGSRRYFRVRYGGSVDGRMVFISNIDRVWPEDDSSGEATYLDTRSGSGGLFNLQGQLVATLESTNGFQSFTGSNIGSEEYNEIRYNHNEALAALLKDFGVDRYSDYSGTNSEIERVIFGLRVPSNIITTIDASGE